MGYLTLDNSVSLNPWVHLPSYIAKYRVSGPRFALTPPHDPMIISAECSCHSGPGASRIIHTEPISRKVGKMGHPYTVYCRPQGGFPDPLDFCCVSASDVHVSARMDANIAAKACYPIFS